MLFLIIEEDEILAKLLMNCVDHAGKGGEIHPLVANSISEARTILENFSPDIVFWDGRVRDGLTIDGFLEETVNRFPKAVHIAASGNMEYFIEQTKQGCNHLMPKPFQLAEMTTVFALAEAKSRFN